MTEKHNLPENKEEIIDILAKTKYLNIDTEIGSMTLESHNSVNIQPKGTPFGVKIKADGDNSSATLTFDTKKMRDPNKKIDFDKLVNDAIMNYENQEDQNE
jgi:hypothetical protein